jgi:uroporphyrinogen III methyltransferase / synthase
VLVTRAPEQSADFIKLLEAAGAHVESAPLISIGPPPDERALQDAVERADGFDWLIFTSAAGVEAFARARRRPLRTPPRIAVVGPATEQALMDKMGVHADLVPTEYSSGALADALAQRAAPQDSVLVVAARDASPVLVSKLRAIGYRVEKIDAYTTVEIAPRDLSERIGRSDVIALASPSAVRALTNALGGDATAGALRGKLLACIGPVTLAEARGRGLHVEVIPDDATLPALVDALCRYYTTPRS